MIMDITHWKPMEWVWVWRWVPHLIHYPIPQHYPCGFSKTHANTSLGRVFFYFTFLITICYAPNAFHQKKCISSGIIEDTIYNLLKFKSSSVEIKKWARKLRGLFEWGPSSTSNCYIETDQYSLQTNPALALKAFRTLDSNTRWIVLAMHMTQKSLTQQLACQGGLGCGKVLSPGGLYREWPLWLCWCMQVPTTFHKQPQGSWLQHWSCSYH